MIFWIWKVTIDLTASQENYSNIFTPKNEEEVDFIWLKYKIEHPIWTDFTRVNKTTFYRQFFNPSNSYRGYILNHPGWVIWDDWSTLLKIYTGWNTDKFIKKSLFHSSAVGISCEWSQNILEWCWYDWIWKAQKWNSVGMNNFYRLSLERSNLFSKQWHIPL